MWASLVLASVVPFASKAGVITFGGSGAEVLSSGSSLLASEVQPSTVRPAISLEQLVSCFCVGSIVQLLFFLCVSA